MKIKAEQEVRLPRAEDHLRWPADRQVPGEVLPHTLPQEGPTGPPLDLGLPASGL